MPAPTVDPERRDRREVLAPTGYEKGQRVWVFQDRWLPGLVLRASTLAVCARHQVEADATGVDDFLAARVMSRTDETFIDRRLEAASGAA